MDRRAPMEGEAQHLPRAAHVGRREVGVRGEGVEVGGEVEDGVNAVGQGGEGMGGEPHQRFGEVARDGLESPRDVPGLGPGQGSRRIGRNRRRTPAIAFPVHGTGPGRRAIA